MDNKDFVINTLKQIGFKIAQELQNSIPDLEVTEIVAQEEYLPKFDNTRQYLNFKAGYTCISPKGNAVRLLQPYDSLVYPQEPEELLAQWGFYWSTDPKKAKPFIKSAESPYYKGDCCIEKDGVYQSTLDTANVYAPSEYPAGWEYLGNVSEFGIN